MKQRLTLPLLLLVSAAIFTIGINWGLPSKSDDVYLLGADGHGKRLEALTAGVPDVDASGGADVVAAEGPADKIISLNDTDAKKARILCRYRLYSSQPDEMITFRSLSQMKPSHGDFDPRLYQYGGLWIYGVGAVIELGKLIGFLQIVPRSQYIEHPELFGRFYIAARLYSAVWGLVGVWAVYAIVRRWTDRKSWLAAAAGLCFAMMPVVVNAAHEAKPHLAGCSLIFLAVLAADRFIQSGRIRWAALAGAFCGAAMGMVLWGVVALVLIPVMAFLSSKRISLVVATCMAIVVYSASNPYVIDHLFFNPSVLRSNLGNTAAMYGLGRPDLAFLNAIKLMAFGAGPAVLIGGIVGCVTLWKNRHITKRGVGALLASVAIVAAVEFFATAAGKPGEYGRFALVPDAALLLAAFACLGGLSVPRASAGAIILLAATLPMGLLYVSGFWAEAELRNVSPRRIEAAVLQDELVQLRAQYQQAGGGVQPTLGVYADPAPYCLPPVDLDGWKIVRLPRDYDLTHGSAAVDVIVRPNDSAFLIWWTPLSWAEKNFQIQLNR